MYTKKADSKPHSHNNGLSPNQKEALFMPIWFFCCLLYWHQSTPIYISSVQSFWKSQKRLIRRAATAVFTTPPQLFYIQNAKGQTNFKAISSGIFIGRFFLIRLFFGHYYRPVSLKYSLYEVLNPLQLYLHLLLSVIFHLVTLQSPMEHSFFPLFCIQQGLYSTSVSAPLKCRIMCYFVE